MQENMTRNKVVMPHAAVNAIRRYVAIWKFRLAKM